MKTLIDIDKWSRKEHFRFFSQFDEPFFGITVTVDCTRAYLLSKANKKSFFLTYLYMALKAVNEIENFKYRIVDGHVYLFEQINASSTINRSDGTFGFELDLGRLYHITLYDQCNTKSITSALKTSFEASKIENL